MKQGWRPKRTIIYCAWDGEEPGLLGSTEWVEEHDAELKQHAVVYINSDSSSRGYLGVSGSHTLERVVNELEREFPIPEKNMSVWKRAQMRRIARAATAGGTAGAARPCRASALARWATAPTTRRSSTTPAWRRSTSASAARPAAASITPSTTTSTGTRTLAIRTSCYEKALAQMGGTTVMRMADADLLPYDPSDSADTVKRYVGELKTELKKKQDEVRERNRQIEEGVFTATADPHEALCAAVGPADAAVHQLRTAGERS